MKNISVKKLHSNLDPQALIKIILEKKEGLLTDTGAIVCKTGKFTGRSPKDRFIVLDELTKNTVDWGEINIPFDQDDFYILYNKMVKNLENKEVYMRDALAGADPNYQMPLRVYNTYAYHNLFCYNMFIRPEAGKQSKTPEFTIICDPDFKADPEVDGTRSENFAIINFPEKIILIGGTGYTGEMKKGIFSVLNYMLPLYHKALTMHCSVNVGNNNDTSLFFGLSGTGKTTLSADPNRSLIGDDEHVWTSNTVFNIEGGCYAKTIDLSQEKEPEIFNAIKDGAILENMNFVSGTKTIDFKDKSITENMRVSYPIHHIENAVEPSIAPRPTNIFFLTCDAYGVLPPISKLNKNQAMYHFLSGYTAKVSGTEMGITEPTTAFSACFGSPFLPLHPTVYADMLGDKIDKNQVNIWLVNTGWTGGAYGEGSRISLKHTRALIRAAMSGHLKDVEYSEQKLFGLMVPKSCPDVPAEMLMPVNTWKDKDAYYKKAKGLAAAFHKNFRKYESNASNDIINGAPKRELESVT